MNQAKSNERKESKNMHNNNTRMQLNWCSVSSLAISSLTKFTRHTHTLSSETKNEEKNNENL